MDKALFSPNFLDETAKTGVEDRYRIVNGEKVSEKFFLLSSSSRFRFCCTKFPKKKKKKYLLLSITDGERIRARFNIRFNIPKNREELFSTLRKINKNKTKKKKETEMKGRSNNKNTLKKFKVLPSIYTSYTRARVL